MSGDVLTKRYRSWSRGEPQREWSALNVLAAAAPDLVPRPLDAGLDAEPPFVRMSIVPGTPLGGALSKPELAALETALRELWSVPGDGLRPIDAAALRDLVVARRPAASGLVAEALDAALAWPRLPASVDGVVGHGDPNLSNYLWDGMKVRIVDFEDAGLSSVEFELANLVEHISSQDTEWDEFVDRFQVDEPRFRAARVLFASFWLTLLMPGGPSADRNPPGTAESQATRLLSLVR